MDHCLDWANDFAALKSRVSMQNLEIKICVGYGVGAASMPIRPSSKAAHYDVCRIEDDGIAAYINGEKKLVKKSEIEMWMVQEESK